MSGESRGGWSAEMSETIIMTHADSIWVKALEAHSDSLQSKVDLLQAKLDALEGKTEFLANVVETANDGVSNQLSASNNLLAIVGVIVTIAAIWLGVQIEKKWHKMQSMAATVDEKKKTVEELAKIVDEKAEKVDNIAQETEDLDKKIHSSLTTLYQDLRKEETNALLDRLVQEPKDVSNLNTVLMAREIDESGYSKFREAYDKLKKEEAEHNNEFFTHDYIGEYFVLFYQHFFYQAIKDDTISSEFGKFYDSILSRAYESDVIRSTIGLCAALSEDDITHNKEDILVDYLKALNRSQYKELIGLSDVFEHKMTTKELLQNAINRCTKEGVYLSFFGINPPEGDNATPKQS